MKAYIGPAALMLVSAAFLAIEGGMAYDFFENWPLRIAGVVYAVGAVWWVSVAAGAKHRLWLHMALVWVPMIAPSWPLAIAMEASERNDSAGLAVLLHFGPAAVACLLSMVGALAIMTKLTGPREH